MEKRGTMPTIGIGDTVGYAKPFLRSIHASTTDPMWRARGIVVEIKDYAFKVGPSKRIIYVRGFETTNEDGLAHVLESNLAVVGSFRHTV